MVNGESDGGGNWRKKESSFLSFLAFPLSCLARLACLVLAWLRFGEREGAGGQGLWVHCACYGCYAMQSTDGWAVVYRMVAGVACCSDTFLVGSRQAHTHFLTHSATAGTRARWWEEEEEEDEEQQGLQAREEGMNDRTGNGHWAFTQNPDGPSMGILGRGRCARESFKRLQGCSCVESGGPTRKCRVSAAHTGGCCFLLRGYPTSPVYRSMVHYTDYGHTVSLPLLPTARGVIYVLYAVLYVASPRYITQVPRSSTHPAGRNSLKELPGWDPGKDQNCPVLAALPKWTLSMGPGNGLWVGSCSMASMQLLNNKTHAIAVQGSIHPPDPSHQGSLVSSTGGTNVRSAQTK